MRFARFLQACVGAWVIVTKVSSLVSQYGQRQMRFSEIPFDGISLWYRNPLADVKMFLVLDTSPPIEPYCGSVPHIECSVFSFDKR